MDRHFLNLLLSHHTDFLDLLDLGLQYLSIFSSTTAKSRLRVDGFVSALIGGIIISVVSIALSRLLIGEEALEDSSPRVE